MNIIYEPKGKAREYAPLAANLYTGCNHGCKYCYAPAIRRKTRHEYHNPILTKNVIKRFEKDCNILYGDNRSVLFCFMTDPYNSLENKLNITRQCLEIAYRNKIKISILTKNINVLKDIELFKKFGSNIQIGFTLTFDNTHDSLEWEPEASNPFERLETLEQLKKNNIPTWASFEPVINPEQSLNMLKWSLNFVDKYKIGKINNFDGLDKTIDWNLFL